MASISIIQNLTAHSSANAPASVTINSAATAQGSMLIWTVTATSSGTPVISSPGGSWVLVYNTSVANLAYAMYMQLNSASGITTITSNLATTTAGGACAGFLEMQTTPINQPWAQETQTSYNQVGTSVPWTGIPRIVNILETELYYVHRAASTYTANNSANWNTGYGSGLSTGSTTNAQHDGYLGLTFEQLGQDVGGGTLGTSVASALGLARFTSGISFPYNFNTVPNGGITGIMQPTFFQGMTGG
jgi:hypothetical protein